MEAIALRSLKYHCQGPQRTSAMMPTIEIKKLKPLITWTAGRVWICCQGQSNNFRIDKNETSFSRRRWRNWLKNPFGRITHCLSLLSQSLLWRLGWWIDFHSNCEWNISASWICLRRNQVTRSRRDLTSEPSRDISNSYDCSSRSFHPRLAQ